MPDSAEKEPQVHGSFRVSIFEAAGRIQPGMPSYDSAQRILAFIEKTQAGQVPKELITPDLVDDLFTVFRAAGIKILIVRERFLEK